MGIGINEVWFLLGVDASLGVSRYVLVSGMLLGIVYILYMFKFHFLLLDPPWVTVERLLGAWARSGCRIPARSTAYPPSYVPFPPRSALGFDDPRDQVREGGGYLSAPASGYCGGPSRNERDSPHVEFAHW